MFKHYNNIIISGILVLLSFEFIFNEPTLSAYQLVVYFYLFEFTQCLYTKALKNKHYNRYTNVLKKKIENSQKFYFL